MTRTGVSGFIEVIFQGFYDIRDIISALKTEPVAALSPAEGQPIGLAAAVPMPSLIRKEL